MFDFLSRVLRHPQDYIAAFTKNKLSLKEHIDHGENVHSFLFNKPTNLDWKAGQHGVWKLPKDEINSGGDWRAFSIASSQHEDIIRISTIITEEPSDFKKVLLKMTREDSITLNGPFGEFHTKQSQKQIVGVAGGVGITPFRALAYEIAHGHLPNTKLTLVYASKSNYLFSEELDEWQIKNPNLKVHYVRKAEEVGSTLDSLCVEHKNEADYYLSGSPGMIAGLSKQLKTKRVTRIITDPFKGYF